MVRVKPILVGVLGLVLLNFAGGCALVDMKIDLAGYQPISKNQGASGAILVAKPSIGLTEKSKDGHLIIGAVKNGFGTRTANTTTDDSVPDWIANATRDELNAAGFSASVVDTLPPAVPAGIEIYINRVNVEDDTGAVTVAQVGEVNLRITLVKNGVAVKTLDVKGVGNCRRIIEANPGATKREALKYAVQAAYEKAMPEIVATFAK